MNGLFVIAATSSSPSVYYAFENSDGVGKSIVVLLLVSSVFTWTIMLDKGMALYRARKLSDRFLARFRNNRGPVTALVREGAANSGPIACVYSEGVERLLEFYEEAAPGSTTFAAAAAVHPGGSARPVAPVRLTDEQHNAIQAVLEREVSIQIMELETRIGLLATMVSASPFFGLFGTVWGVMMAFCGIAAAGKSDFTALAPGVAGALLTTVAGLVVAIPSLIGYNLLTSSIRKMTVNMDNFTEEFMVKLKLERLGTDRTDTAKVEQ